MRDLYKRDLDLLIEKTKRRNYGKPQKEEIISLLNEALELMNDERLKSVVGSSSERFRMWANWHSRVEDVRLEMAGVLGIEYYNPAVDGGE